MRPGSVTKYGERYAQPNCMLLTELWLVARAVQKDASVAEGSSFFDTSPNAVVTCSKFRGHACTTSVGAVNRGSSYRLQEVCLI
jgi:hypothetical protein